MSFIYPRTITITRQAKITAAGTSGYSGLQPAKETVVATALPASIQLDKTGSRPIPGVPADTMGRGDYNIFIPMHLATLGETVEGDVITDDLGVRYKVTNAYWNSLGYNIRGEMLKT